MATVTFTAIETPDMLPLVPGTKYLLQNVSTRFEINVSEGQTAQRTSPAYRIAPLQFLGIRQDADPVWVWTPQGMARARLTFAEAV